jgi:hypothetical protein
VDSNDIFAASCLIALAAFVYHLYVCVEFARIARATGIGFLIMGFIGFFVKIVHIPINNIIMGGGAM